VKCFEKQNTRGPAVVPFKPLSPLHRLGVVIRQYRTVPIVEVVSALAVKVFEVPEYNPNHRHLIFFSGVMSVG